MPIDIEKIVGRVALIVPSIHFTTCTLFMAGYSAGFGQNIGGMFSASDFFTITIQYLAPIYAIGLLLPALNMFVQHRLGRRNLSEIIHDEKDVIRKSILMRRQRKIRKIILFSPIFTLLAVIFIVIQVNLGAIVSYIPLAFVSFVGIMPIIIIAMVKLKIDNLYSEIGINILQFVIIVLAFGMSLGESDRRSPVLQISDGHMRCGEHIVLASIGNRFISSTMDGNRHLIDDECKVKFNFQYASPPPTQYTLKILYDKLSAFVASLLVFHNPPRIQTRA